LRKETLIRNYKLYSTPASNFHVLLLYLEKKENDFPFIYTIDRTVKIGFHLECGSYRAISKLQAK